MQEEEDEDEENSEGNSNEEIEIEPLEEEGQFATDAKDQIVEVDSELFNEEKNEEVDGDWQEDEWEDSDQAILEG